MERANFLRYIVMHSSKQEKKKKSTMNTNISAAPFSLNVYNKSEVRLTAKSLGKLATNLHKLTQFIDDNNEISWEPQTSVQLIT